MKQCILLISALLCLAGRCGYRETKGIPYWPSEKLEKASEYQRTTCTLDLKVPEGVTNFATYVFFHGGGLYTGKPCYPYYPAADESIARVAVSYRLMPNCGFAQCIEDAAAATAWVLDHIAEYGGDPKKVVIGGHSAGGYLTCMVGMDARWLAAFKHKPTDLLGLISVSGQVTEHFAVRKYAGDRDPQFLPKINERAPLHYVAAKFPPLCIICGDRKLEWKCRVEENEFMYVSMLNCGRAGLGDEFHECPGKNHGTVSGPAHEIGQAFVRKLLSREFPPDLLGGSTVDFEAASSRRFPVGGVADDAKRPMTELVDFRLSPGASIDNGFALSEGQPAMMTMILKGNPEKADALEQLEKDDRASRRKNETPLLVEFDFPAGVTVADCADGTVVAATEKDGRRQYRIAMSADFDAGLWKIKGRYNWWRRMAFLVTSSVAAGGVLPPGRAWLSWKGERISNVQEIVFSVIARLPRVASPKRFYIGCETASHVTGLSTAGFAAWADFVAGCGLNALHVNLGTEPARRDERMNALRSAGVREISVMPSTRVYNGYDICARQPPPAGDRFVSHPKAFPAADGEANRARVERGLCPSAVYERRDYFMNEVVPSLRRELAPYDGVWSNWEPYMACGKGCFCDGCRKKFAAFAGLSEEEMAKDWPEQMLAKGRHAKSFVQFQSVEHGKLMRVLNEEIAKLCRPGSDIGFVPGVAWCTMCSTWRTNGYERATSPIDYAGDFRWISPWGPYAVWMSQEPYVYSKWRNLRTFAAARDVRNQVDADYPEGNRPKLMAYPHGYQGDEWIIRPEAMEMNVDSFFFNGWQAALLYRFPNGYDQRWWAAFARCAEKAARYEDIVFDGRRCDGEVELEVTSPFASDNSDSGQWTRGLPIRLPMLQHVAYEKDGKLIVACFNFWEKAPVFFRIRRNGKDLGEFYCGALRTKVWEFGAGAAPRGFTDEDVAAWRKALHGKLARAAADDRAFEGVPDSRGVTVENLIYYTR